MYPRWVCQFLFRAVSFINDSGMFFAVSLVSRLVSGLGSGILVASCSTVLLYSTSWKPATVVVSTYICLLFQTSTDA